MNRRVRILIECIEYIASVKVGVLDTLKPLADRGLCETLFVNTGSVTRKHIAWCDVFITVRGSEKMTLHIIDAVRQAGRPVVYFLDDDLLNVPGGFSCSEYYAQEDIQNNIKECLNKSDVLWCVSSMVAQKYQKFCGGKCVLCPSPAQVDEKNALAPRKAKPIKILFAGSVDHSETIQKVLSPAVRQICDEFGNEVEFLFIGGNPAITDLSQVQHHRHIDNYDAYQDLVMHGGFHLGLAIVGTDEFYQCKYYNKYFEYTKIGAIGIYTKTQPYTSVIEDGKNGILCDNTPEGWVDAIKRGIAAVNGAAGYVENSISHIKREFEPYLVAERFMQQVPAITSFYAAAVKPKDINLRHRWYYIDRIKELWGNNKKILFIPILLFKFCRCIIRIFKRLFKGTNK